MPFQLRHIEGSKAGALDTFDQDRIRIGRQPDNDLPFGPQKEASVSDITARSIETAMRFSSKTCRVETAGFVNGRKIDQPVLFKDGDVVQSRRADRKFHF